MHGKIYNVIIPCFFIFLIIFGYAQMLWSHSSVLWWIRTTKAMFQFCFSMVSTTAQILKVCSICPYGWKVVLPVQRREKHHIFLHDLIHLATHHLMEKLEMQGAGQTNSKVKWPQSFIKDFNKLYNSSLIWEYFKLNTNFYFL